MIGTLIAIPIVLAVFVLSELLARSFVRGHERDALRIAKARQRLIAAYEAEPTSIVVNDVRYVRASEPTAS